MFKNLLLVCMAAFALASCHLDHNNDCYSFATAAVSAIDAPTTATVNQPININLSFMVGNGCGSFYNADSYTEGDTTEVLVKVKFQGCMCTQQVMTLQHEYSFTPAVSGPHYFKYFVSEGNYIRDTIWVQ